LLLRRSPTSGNPNSLGLPGGNADPEDNNDLLATAIREATEEMGAPPPHIVLDSFLTRRGKRQQKHYTVYLAELSPETKAAWKPELNEEHTAFYWVPLDTLHLKEDLHPVVKLLLLEEPTRAQVMAALESLAIK
jgi:8-oxo-dGTP pyrophosphatase MutT (NUDIX family)